MPIEYIQYKGKTILYCDYRNQSGEQAIATLYEEAEEQKTWTQKGLVLSDYHGAKASREFMEHARKLTKEVFEKKEHKAAAIGLTGVQMVLLQAYNTFSKDKLIHFKSEEEAREWLIKN